jgi:hypothetical protein
MQGGGAAGQARSGTLIDLIRAVCAYHQPPDSGRPRYFGKPAGVFSSDESARELIEPKGGSDTSAEGQGAALGTSRLMSAGP